MLMSPASQSERRPGGPRPWLVCLDLQREYVVPGRPLFDPNCGEVVSACAKVIAHARASGWRVVHAHRRRNGDLFCGETLFAAPIEGLRPLISEPVFVRSGLSAFSNRDFALELRRARDDGVCLIGFSMASSGLATALAAIDAGLTLTLVEDAIDGGSHEHATDTLRTVLGPHARWLSSADLIVRTTPMAELVP
jgi:nicotinamidase-related amidase